MKAKTSFQRLIAGAIAFVLLSATAAPSLATGIETDSCPDAEEIFAYVESEANKMSENEVSYTAIALHKLKKFGSENEYSFIELSPHGYAVYDDESGVIEELIPGAETLPYDFESGEEYYYGGPMSYYVKNGERYTDLSDGTLLSDEYVLYLENLVASISAERSAPVFYSVPKVTMTYALEYSEYFTDKNKLGDDHGDAGNNTISTQVACEMLLGYYNCYLLPGIVDDYYVQPNGYGFKPIFIQWLNQYFFGSSLINLEQVKSGLQEYVRHMYSAVFVETVLGNSKNVLNLVEQKIRADRPVIVSRSQGNSNGSSTMQSFVVYRIDATYGGNLTGELSSATYYAHSGTLRSNDTNGNNYTDVSFSYSWVTDALYLDSYLLDH